MVRRHSRGGDGEYHYGPSLTVISGNYVTGKRRGVVDGVDFGFTGTGAHHPAHLLSQRSLYSTCAAGIVTCWVSSGPLQPLQRTLPNVDAAAIPRKSRIKLHA